jgi:hypothetical protein
MSLRSVGATIKRVIDDWGRTPLPYAGADGATVYPPAYQQVLMTVNIALRRQLWQLDYFSEGSIPDALIGVPVSWTPDQIKQFQDYWDTEFAGDLAKRRRAKFVPGEAAAKVVQTKEPSHKDDFDEWLARIICYAFSVPPQWATKVMNRATADNQSEQAADEGLEPTKEWVKDLVDEIIADEFASPDLEIAWLDEDEADPKGLEAVLEGRVKLGAVTLNEMRDVLGLDPYTNAAADRPMVLTATGYVPIEANAEGEGGAANVQQAGEQRNESAERAGIQSPNAPGAPIIQKYNPDQPRVPAGSSDGGQWTSGDGSVSITLPTPANQNTRDLPAQRRHYAALETGPLTAATEDPPRVSSSSADDHYSATQVVTAPSAITGDAFIDGTTAKLTTILVRIMNGLERTPGITPQAYGRMVHVEFADAVIAAVLPGIAATDVETTFPEDRPYGSTNSIRTDVVLRDEKGIIIAIYDVKTGAPLGPSRVAELRAKTRAPDNTPIIELRFEGPVLKIQFAGLDSPMSESFR